MTVQDSKPVVKSLDDPDETRPTADRGRVEIVSLGAVQVGRAVFEPGWHWAEHVRPIVHSELCEVTHTGYVEAGRLGVRMADGTELELKPGDAFVIPAGHDAWVVGSESCVTVDFSGVEEFARR